MGTSAGRGWAIALPYLTPRSPQVKPRHPITAANGQSSLRKGALHTERRGVPIACSSCSRNLQQAQVVCVCGGGVNILLPYSPQAPPASEKRHTTGGRKEKQWPAHTNHFIGCSLWGEALVKVARGQRRHQRRHRVGFLVGVAHLPGEQSQSHRLQRKEGLGGAEGRPHPTGASCQRAAQRQGGHRQGWSSSCQTFRCQASLQIFECEKPSCSRRLPALALKFMM